MSFKQKNLNHIYVWKTQINQEKVRAYLATDYRLGHTENDIILNIGKRSERLAFLFISRGVDCGALITAYNPRGIIQTDEANNKAYAKLLDEIEWFDLRRLRDLEAKREQTSLLNTAILPSA